MLRKFNPKQKTALAALADRDFTYHLHYGGSRSGKTVLDCRFIILRAIKYPGTRHLLCRASKASVMSSAWKTTLLPMLSEDFDTALYRVNANGVIDFSNGSSIWAGGFENNQHLDELLGKEWATILIEEATDLKYKFFQKLLTRLNWNPALSNIPLKLVVECNPPLKSHWLYRYFFGFTDFETKEPLNDLVVKQISKTHFHPYDNRENLNPEYIKNLEGLSGANRKRFFDGVFYDDPVGMVYDFKREVNVVDEPVVFQRGAESWRAWDFGISPSQTFIMYVQVVPVPQSEEFPLGVRLNIIGEECATEKSYLYYANLIKSREWPWKDFSDAGDPAGHSRNESLESWVSKLREEGIYIQTPSGMSGIDDYISHANIYVPFLRINEKQCPRTVEFFENWCRPKDRDGRVVEGAKPNHDEFSHGGTAFYYFTAKRFPIHKMFFSQR